MFDKPRKLIDQKVVQPIKDATAIAVTALLVGILALIVAVIR